MLSSFSSPSFTNNNSSPMFDLNLSPFTFFNTEQEDVFPILNHSDTASNSSSDEIRDILDSLRDPVSPEKKKKKSISLSIDIPTDKRKQVKKVVESVSQEQSIPINRSWQTVFVKEQYRDKLNVDVTSKTRCEEPVSCVPSTMYSSLKYEIIQKVTGEVCVNEQFLISKITVVDSKDHSEIKKNGSSILKGTVQVALNKQPHKKTEQFEGKLKAQFTDVSFHHNKKDFCYEISYSLPSNVNEPIMKKRSAPFKVLARKPCQNKKRKRTETTTTINTETTSTAATSLSNSTNVNPTGLGMISNLLQELQRASKKLKPNEKILAKDLLIQTLRNIDPSFSQGTTNFNVIEAVPFLDEEFQLFSPSNLLV